MKSGSGSGLEAGPTKSGRRKGGDGGRGGVVSEWREQRRGGLDVEDVTTRAKVLVKAASR